MSDDIKIPDYCTVIHFSQDIEELRSAAKYVMGNRNSLFDELYDIKRNIDDEIRCIDLISRHSFSSSAEEDINIMRKAALQKEVLDKIKSNFFKENRND